MVVAIAEQRGNEATCFVVQSLKSKWDSSDNQTSLQSSVFLAKTETEHAALSFQSFHIRWEQRAIQLQEKVRAIPINDTVIRCLSALEVGWH